MTLSASQARQSGFSPRFGAAAGCPYMVRQSGPGDTVAWKSMDVCWLARRGGLRVWESQTRVMK